MNSELERKIVGYLERGNIDKGRFNSLLNLKFDSCNYHKKTVRFRYDVEGEWSLNPYGGVHGGVACSILDTAMGIGAIAFIGYYVTTMDLNVNFIKPMLGKKFYIDVEYSHLGNKVVRANARIIDSETDQLCAMAMAGFMTRKNIEFK